MASGEGHGRQGRRAARAGVALLALLAGAVGCTSQVSTHRTVVAQDVVAIEFDDQGLVNRIDRHDLNGAREIDLVDRETPTAGNELTVLEQFLGNIGRFNPPADDE